MPLGEAVRLVKNTRMPQHDSWLMGFLKSLQIPQRYLKKIFFCLMYLLKGRERQRLSAGSLPKYLQQPELGARCSLDSNPGSPCGYQEPSDLSLPRCLLGSASAGCCSQGPEPDMEPGHSYVERRLLNCWAEGPLPRLGSDAQAGPCWSRREPWRTDSILKQANGFRC